MRNFTILITVSLVSLIALILPSVFFLAGRMELSTVKWTMLAATVVWFLTATPWLWNQKG